jgi:hypothetical protein
VIGRATVVSAALAAFFLSFGILHFGVFARGVLMDTPVYERYGDAIVHGGTVPYRDFGVEYPPGALPVFAAPSLVARSGDFDRYRETFEALMALLGAAAVGITAAVARRLDAALFAGFAPLALGPVVVSRFDLWPALLSVAAVGALLADRRRLAAVLLGAAIAAKLYPGVLLPVAAAYVWGRHGRRAAATFAGIAVGVVVLVFLPFVVVSPHGVWSSISGQASRPLQIESTGAALLLGAHQAWGLALEQTSSHGSDNLAGSLPHAVATLQGVLAPLVLIALWIAFARGEATRERLLRYAAASVCAFIVFSKVLSPQYLIWLIPLVPLVRSRLAWSFFAAALVLTQLWFPHRYLDLAYGFDARASWLVLARDLALLGVLVALVRPQRVVVAALAAAGLAAAGAAAAGVASPSALAHTRVLDETGAASTCAARKQTPALDPGTVRYAVTGHQNTSDHPVCVTVVVRSRRHEPLFSAAYLNGFSPVDPGRNYLGDAGTCTDVAQHPTTTIAYAFRVPAHARFAIEVEQCTSNRAPPAYALTLGLRR